MKFREPRIEESEAVQPREEVRELAEALSVYRSAMHHLAERASAHPRPASVRSARFQSSRRFSLFLAPALGATLAAGILLPVYAHLHNDTAPALQSQNTAVPDPGSARASIDDTALMNQIDSQLSETVPDALEPLAALSAQAATQPSVTEKK